MWEACNLLGKAYILESDNMSSNLSSHHSLKDLTLSKLINRTDSWILHYNTEMGVVPFS